MPVGGMFEPASGTETADVLFGRLGRYPQFSGNGKIGLAVKLRWKTFKKFLSGKSRCACRGIRPGGGQEAKHLGGVLQQHANHGDGGAVIGIAAYKAAFHSFPVVNPK